MVRRLSSKCGFINNYTPNEERKRKDVWDELMEQMRKSEVWWVIGGDFNTDRSKEKRIEKREIGRFAAHFDNFINEVGLVDLPLTKAKFMWCNDWEEALSAS